LHRVALSEYFDVCKKAFHSITPSVVCGTPHLRCQHDRNQMYNSEQLRPRMKSVYHQTRDTGFSLSIPIAIDDGNSPQWYSEVLLSLYRRPESTRKHIHHNPKHEENFFSFHLRSSTSEPESASVTRLLAISASLPITFALTLTSPAQRLDDASNTQRGKSWLLHFDFWRTS